MDISKILMILNYTIVLLYGIILTAAFADALKTKKDWNRIVFFFLIVTLAQAIMYFFVDFNTIEMVYPLLVHLPLALFLIFICNKKPATAFSCVFISYLCCIPRQWLGILVATIFGRGTELSYFIQIICSFPILALTIKFISPLMIQLMKKTQKSVILLGAMPFIYYVFVYATTVYSKVLYNGKPVIIGLILSFFVLSYFAFAVSYSREIRKRSEAENIKNILALQAEQAVKEIEAMRNSQHQAATYRHDMRHHFDYINNCLNSGKITEAKDYITQLCTTIENHTVISYCKNETINLILSSFVSKAKKANINMDINVVVSDYPNLPISDFCVILSNALENAIHACDEVEKSNNPFISIKAYQKNGKTFFQIQNSYHGEITFQNDLPKTNSPGHGLGTLSIATSLKHHGGICSFSAENNIFTLRFII